MENKYKQVLETYRCLLSCRKNLPGLSLESAFNEDAVRDLEEEYAWLQQQKQYESHTGINCPPP